MSWWGWMILGALLFGAELLAIDAQFFLVFVGLSAALVGLLGLLGIAMPEWGQWLLFAGLSLTSMFTFRKALYERIRGEVQGYSANITGETIMIDEDLSPGEGGRAEYRGTRWNVVNKGDTMIVAGGKATVVEVDGLTLHVIAN
jgi:membrane protein implicated in regulation of membrane protease activity